MFKKLVSNLSFSPTTIEQISFYSKRLKKEESVRRLGLILIVLSMCVQLFAALVPPEKSLAAHAENDVIPGGAQTVEQLREKIKGRDAVIGLYAKYGLSVNELNAENVKDRNFSFDFKDQGSKGTKTVGREKNPGGSLVHSHKGNKFYARNAGVWSGTDNAFYFGKQKVGSKYYKVWVLKDCGNIAFRQVPANEPEKDVIKFGKPKIPAIKITKPKPTPTSEIPKPTPTIPEEPEPVVPVTFVPSLQIPTDTPEPEPEVIPVPEEVPVPKEIAISKTARNTTQNLSPELTVSSSSVARASDVIEYTLTATNSDNEPRTFTMQDYVGDILDYADIDMASVMIQDAEYSAQNRTITWKDQVIPAGGSISRTFKATLKSVIPSTNQPNKTSPKYDCVMHNEYGNETNINVDCSPLKAVETLPNTGPGTTITISVVVVMISSYFFMRNRLLAKEVGIIKKSYQSGY